MKTDISTRCIHSQQTNEHAKHFGAISYPIYQTATYAHPGIAQTTGYDYSRLQNPTREQLEKIVASLEDGVDALAFSSGMAAIATLMEIFEPGDHLIIDSDLYGGSIRLFDNISRKNGITFSAVDCCQENIVSYMKDETKAIYIETPTNPMMNITDIEALSKIAKQYALLLVVDNTFLSPYFQNPLNLGADIVIHSGTKYLGGHNDTLAGFLITSSHEMSEKLRFLIKTTGAGLSPFDSWLIMRGIKTLAIRMEKAQENTLKIVDWLLLQKSVSKVIYPGIASHPGHQVMKKQSRGFGAIITFLVNDKTFAQEVLENIKIIQFAESLGGVETLMTYPITQTHADLSPELLEKNGITEKVLRLSVGIEAADDLIGDLQAAFIKAEEKLYERKKY